MSLVLILAALFLAALSLLDLKQVNPYWAIALLAVAILVGGNLSVDPRTWFHRSPPPSG